MATRVQELRCKEVQARFDDSQSHIASLSAQLAQAQEGRHTAEAQSVLQEGVAAAAKSRSSPNTGATQERDNPCGRVDEGASLVTRRDACKSCNSPCKVRG